MDLTRAMRMGSAARLVRVGLLLVAMVPAHLAFAQATQAPIAQPSLKQAPALIETEAGTSAARLRHRLLPFTIYHSLFTARSDLIGAPS